MNLSASNRLKPFQEKQPKLDLRQFFNGTVEGWGSLFDYLGRPTRRFYVKIQGTWDAKNGRLDEWFDFDDGEKTERIWNISYQDDQYFFARAGDVIGQAIGQQAGNSVNLRYRLRVPYKKSTIDLTMDDWMYLVDQSTILNRTKMKKLGLKVGEICLLMRRIS